MAEGEVRDHIRIRNETVGMQEAQGAGLHRATDVERKFLERFGQVSHDHLANLAAGTPIEHQAESAFRIVLADEDDGALKKRAAKLSAVQQQLAFQKFFRVTHAHPNLHHFFQSCKSKKAGLSYNRRWTPINADFKEQHFDGRLGGSAERWETT